MIELSSQINEAVKQQGLAEALIPAAKFLEKDRKETAAMIERLSGEMRQLEPGIRNAAKTLEREQRTIEDYIKGLRSELEDAIGLEKPELTSRIGAASVKLNTLAAKAKATAEPLTELEQAIQTASASQAKKAAQIQQILGAFPEAGVLDLQCMVWLRNNLGLPALGLFDIDSPVVTVTARSGRTDVSIGTQNAEIIIPDPASRGLRKIIETATGVSAKSLEKFHPGHWGINYGEGAGEGPEWEPEYTTPGWISIDAQFPLKSRTIPHQAREIIRRAVKSNLFEQVLLLAEIEAWRVTYSRQPDRPKIQGVVAAQPVTKDELLILGTKLIDGQRTTFILGEFNPSKLEHHVGSEFSEKP